MADRKELEETKNRLHHGLLSYMCLPCCPDGLCRHLLEKDLATLLTFMESKEKETKVLRRELKMRKDRLQKVVVELAEERANRPFGRLFIKPANSTSSDEN